VKAVFPGDTFEACWEGAFLDLPVVLLFKEAHDELKAAERKLEKARAGAGEKPAVPHGMVLVPRGRFVYGPWEEGWKSDLKSNKESKERVDPFFIDVHEVTNEDYAEFLAGIENHERRDSYLGYGMSMGEDGAVQVPDGEELLPVRGVTLEAAAAYAESVGKRLPTEEEWEKAARGEKGRRWPWGEEFDEEATNWEGAGLGRPAPVGSFEKDVSPYGVMDMAGNVSELTSTLDERRPYEPGKLTATDSVIYRGGNFEDGESSTTTTFRWIMTAISGKSEKVGFRCVISEKAWKRRAR
jgi:formylglycine-generating enzyme required for sulfatase activity